MDQLEKISQKITDWIGTPVSILVHTLIFIGIFALKFVGFGVDQILLILTTAVSLEAIYLAIFIQMTVNKTTQSLEGVEEDIGVIQKDMDDIQEDVEDLEEDFKEISEDQEEEDREGDELIETIKDIERQLAKLHKEVVGLKKARQKAATQ